jgi:hypothetical protein
LVGFLAKPTLNWEKPLTQYHAAASQSPNNSPHSATPRSICKMNRDSGIPYRPLTDVRGDPPGATTTASPNIGLGLTASKHTCPHAMHICPDGIVEYCHSLPDLRRQYFAGPQCYPSSYAEQESHRMSPFGAAQSAASRYHSPSFSTHTPYIPSYHLVSNTPLERWQSIESFQPLGSLYGLQTPVRIPETVPTPR